MSCRVPTFLAYAMLVYLLTSIFYLAITRFMGRPFHDSLGPAQLAAKKVAAAERGRVFVGGLVATTAMVYLWQPFKSCA